MECSKPFTCQYVKNVNKETDCLCRDIIYNHLSMILYISSDFSVVWVDLLSIWDVRLPSLAYLLPQNQQACHTLNPNELQLLHVGSGC